MDEEALEARETQQPPLYRQAGITVANLQEQVDRVLAQAEKDKPDAKGAFVAVADLQGYQVGVYAKIPVAGGALKWSFGGYIQGNYKGDLTAAAEARLIF